jgi:hypothetical protein
MIAFHVKVFDGSGGFEIQASACGEEEGNYASEEDDWDEKQDEGSKGEAVCCRLRI